SRRKSVVRSTVLVERISFMHRAMFSAFAFAAAFGAAYAFTPLAAGAPPSDGTSAAPLAVQPLTEHVTRFTGSAENENTVLFDTSDGAILVDTGFAADTTGEQLRGAIRSITPQRVRYTINTHWHGDHVSYNALFSAEGTIVAQENVRTR